MHFYGGEGRGGAVGGGRATLSTLFCLLSEKRCELQKSRTTRSRESRTFERNQVNEIFIILTCQGYEMYSSCTPLMYNIKTRVIQGQTLFGGFAELCSLKQVFQVLTFGILWQGLNLS